MLRSSCVAQFVVVLFVCKLQRGIPRCFAHKFCDDNGNRCSVFFRCTQSKLSPTLGCLWHPSGQIVNPLLSKLVCRLLTKLIRSYLVRVEGY